MATYLDAIVAHHRALAAADDRGVAELEQQLVGLPMTKDFLGALRRSNGASLGLVAEFKRRSPSRGDLALDVDPVQCARDYAEGGAKCLSVLTDVRYFAGGRRDLEQVRRAVELPILRKDFTVSSNDVYDARIMGADAVLLIVAALSDAELEEFTDLARALDLGAVVEVHDDGELERALEVGAHCIGVNQRDLRSFEVDEDRAIALAGKIPEDVVKIAESGIRSASAAARLNDAGYDAVLVGESLVTALDRRQAIEELLAFGVTDGVL